MKIKRITKLQEQQTVHDITVKDHENYILENGVITHNSGLKYSASYRVFLSRAKDKEGTEVVGNLIRAKIIKSRFTKPELNYQMKLSFKSGLDRYYGLVEVAEEAGVWEKSGRYYVVDGNKFFESQIYKDPERFFTPEVLDKIDSWTKEQFTYGTNEEEELEQEEDWEGTGATN